MDLSRGFARLSYAFLAAVVIGGMLAAIFSGQEKASGWIIGTLVFAAGWLAFHHVVAWIARGFRGS